MGAWTMTKTVTTPWPLKHQSRRRKKSLTTGLSFVSDAASGCGVSDGGADASGTAGAGAGASPGRSCISAWRPFLRCLLPRL